MASRAALSVCVLAFGQGVMPVDAQVGFERIAFTGTEAEGTDGLTYAGVHSPVIGPTGKVVYSASLFDFDGALIGSAGLWARDSGHESLIALRGTEAPGVGLHYLALSSAQPAINGDGQVIFGAEYDWPSFESRRGLWMESDGVVSSVAHAAIPVPGLPLREFEGFSRPVINSTGQTVFIGRIDRSPDTGIWATSGGAIETVAREDGEAPGTQGALFDEFRFNPRMNNAGEVVFRAELQVHTGGTTNLNNDGVWMYSGGQTRLLMREGEAVPGLENTVYGAIDTPSFNDSGTMAFFSNLRIDIGDGTIQYTGGVFRREGDEQRLVLRGGFAAPGAPGELVTSVQSPLMNASGDLLFEGRIDNAGQSTDRSRALWLDLNGQTRLIARKGDAAPGVLGAVLGNFEDYAINASGDVAVLTRLASADPDQPIDSRYGLWHYDSLAESLDLIVRTGQLFDTNDDPLIEQLKVVQSISFEQGTTLDGSSGTGFNDLGSVVFGLQFEDGTNGIFVAHIPAPASGLTFVLAGIGLGTRSRRADRSCAGVKREKRSSGASQRKVVNPASARSAVAFPDRRQRP